MFKYSLNRLVKSTPQIAPKRNFWAFVNMMFNKPDPDRIKKLGPDRACAEWALRNGGKVQWTTGDHQTDYNSLPPEGVTLYIKTLDATGSSMSHAGFPHLEGCKSITDIILHNSTYIDDRCLEGLKYGADTIQNLQVSKCPNVTDKGLKHVEVLKKLNTLVVFQLESVKNIDECKNYLKQRLPQLDIKDSN